MDKVMDSKVLNMYKATGETHAINKAFDNLLKEFSFAISNAVATSPAHTRDFNMLKDYVSKDIKLLKTACEKRVEDPKIEFVDSFESIIPQHKQR